MDRARTESHQVNVDLSAAPAEQCGRRVEIERIRVQQCQAALEQMQQQPQGLVGLLTTGLVDKTGVAVRRLMGMEEEFNTRSGSPLYVQEIHTYRAVKRVAVEMTASWLPVHGQDRGFFGAAAGFGSSSSSR